MTLKERILAIPENKIFSVTFRKRTNNELRTMVCRKGVSRYVKGSGGPYKAEDVNLLCVFDMQVAQRIIEETELKLGRKLTDIEKDVKLGSAYRSIPLESIISIKVDGVEYV